MKFSEKLIAARQSKGMTQTDVATALGVSKRTITSYESEGKYPRKRDTYYKLAEIFGYEKTYFIGEQEDFVDDASEQYGSRGKQQAELLIQQASGLFAGGELSEDDKEAVLRSLMDVYYAAKMKNKKYTPKKYLEKKSK